MAPQSAFLQELATPSLHPSVGYEENLHHSDYKLAKPEWLSLLLSILDEVKWVLEEMQVAASDSVWICPFQGHLDTQIMVWQKK